MPPAPLIHAENAAEPRLLVGVHVLTLMANPAWTSAPAGDTIDIYRAVKAAGIEAVQTREPALALEAGLVATGFGRVDRPGQARELARQGKSAGFNATSLHVGTGFERDDEALALAAAVVEAAVVEDYPLFIETHRATITQDMKRTLDLVEKLPDMRFNGDFSHWYTGHEMTYGDINEKLDRLRPVTDRTCFIHGRISSPGAIQIPVRDGSQESHVAVFREFWTRSFIGFLQTARPGDCFGFYPELLPASFHYARLIRGADGELTEEADRWQEALHLISIARECWDTAREKVMNCERKEKT